jgi:hypothetical protein
MKEVDTKATLLYDSGLIPRRKKDISPKERFLEMILIAGALIAGFFTIGYVIIGLLGNPVLSILEWILVGLGIFLAIIVITAVIMGSFIGTDVQHIIITNVSIIIMFRSLLIKRPDKIIPMTKSTILFSNEVSKFPAMVFIYKAPYRMQKEIFLLFKDDIPNITRFLQIISGSVSVDPDTFCNYAIAKKIVQKE